MSRYYVDEDLYHGLLPYPQRQGGHDPIEIMAEVRRYLRERSDNTVLFKSRDVFDEDLGKARSYKLLVLEYDSVWECKEWDKNYVNPFNPDARKYALIQKGSKHGIDASKREERNQIIRMCAKMNREQEEVARMLDISEQRVSDICREKMDTTYRQIWIQNRPKLLKTWKTAMKWGTDKDDIADAFGWSNGYNARQEIYRRIPDYQPPGVPTTSV